MMKYKIGFASDYFNTICLHLKDVRSVHPHPLSLHCTRDSIEKNWQPSHLTCQPIKSDWLTHLLANALGFFSPFLPAVDQQ